MNLKLIDYFIKLCEVGNISKSAEALGTSQPAISRELAKLEKKYKTKLFQRLPAGLKLTPSGEIFLHEINKIKKITNEIENKISQLENQYTAKFKLSIHSIIATNIIPKFEKDLKSIDGLEVDFILQDSKKGQQDVLQGRCDFAIVAEADDYPELIKIKLWTEKIVLASQDGTLKNDVYYNPNMIDAQRLLSKFKSTHQHSIQDYNLASLIAIETNSMVLVPSSQLLIHKQLKTIRDLRQKITISLIYRSDLLKTKSVKKVITLLKKNSQTH